MAGSGHPWRCGAAAGAAALAALAACAGCGGRPPAFAPNRVYIRMQERAVRMDMSPQHEQDIADVLTLLFGTPDEPRLPEAAAPAIGRVLDPALLRLAAGPVRSDQQGQAYGLYRKHCAACHGLSGDGAGPASAYMRPYPRDFRKGVFKFKTTAKGAKPTEDDLVRVLQRGLPGTAMPSYRLLPERNLRALAAYVKYLSIRGEVERLLVFESANELEPGARLVDVPLADARWKDLPEGARRLIGSILEEVVGGWIAAPDAVVRVPQPPDPLETPEAIRRGRALFAGEVANCVKCHGETAEGTGQTEDFDDWTLELDPTNQRVVQEYLVLGALPPRPILPRNLRLGVYTGGGDPQTLYLRLINGIDGTPMPGVVWKPDDAPEDQEGLTTADIWALVAYVRWLPKAPADEQPLAAGAADGDAARGPSAPARRLAALCWRPEAAAASASRGVRRETGVGAAGRSGGGGS